MTCILKVFLLLEELDFEKEYAKACKLMTKNEKKTVVLVGTYKTNQLEKWPNYYNYPITDKDKIKEQDATLINELWLFKGLAKQKTYAAEFVGVKTREELIADYAYPASGKAHAKRYLLFKTEEKYVPTESADKVIIRLKDFATSLTMRKQLKAYLESDARGVPEIAVKLPGVVRSIPKVDLCVCESALQMDFIGLLYNTKIFSGFREQKCDNKTFRFIDLFSGIGGLHIAYASAGARCVYSNEWNKYSQQTYYANFGILPDDDITKVAAEDIPDHDILLAGFPCQPFSIAGVSKKQSLGRATGFEDKTQGTLFFDVCRILKTKRPKAFMLENVKNLCSHDRGRTFKIIQESLAELNYKIFFQVLDGKVYVPQHRERIVIVGFDVERYGENINFEFALKPALRQPVMRDILESEVNEKYTLSDKLWVYLQNYAAKHKAAGNGFGYGIAPLDGISRTISARYYKDGSEILIAQKGKNPRRLTPRECARLQGFPDSFKIPVSDTQAYKQFGNSVVVPLMTEVAKLVVGKLQELDDAIVMYKPERMEV